MSILPIGDIEPEILEMLPQRLSVFPFRIKVLKKTSVPQQSYNDKRDQYESSYFLKMVRKYPGDRGLGITDVDLYAEPLNFVFGQAEISGKAAVISLHRLKGEKEIYHSRAVKEAVHELGHTIGMEHCKNAKCVMHFSNCLEETDIKEEKFCKNCQEELERKVKFL